MTSTQTIVAIGDSITIGYPYAPTSSWVRFAANELGITIINRGIDGDRTAGMVARFPHHVLRHKPSYVVIMGGSNDAFDALPAVQVHNNIRSMVELAVSEGVIPILGLPIPINDPEDEKHLLRYRSEMKEYAAAAGIDIIDFYSAVTDSSNGRIKAELDFDGIHLNEAGYQLMGKVAVQFLKIKLGR